MNTYYHLERIDKGGKNVHELQAVNNNYSPITVLHTILRVFDYNCTF